MYLERTYLLKILQMVNEQEQTFPHLIYEHWNSTVHHNQASRQESGSCTTPCHQDKDNCWNATSKNYFPTELKWVSIWRDYQCPHDEARGHSRVSADIVALEEREELTIPLSLCWQAILYLDKCIWTRVTHLSKFSTRFTKAHYDGIFTIFL